MNPSTCSNDTSSASYSQLSNPSIWDQQPTHSNISMEFNNEIITNLEAMDMNISYPSSSHQDVFPIDPLTNSYPTHLSPNPQFNHPSLSSAHNTPFDNQSQFPDCVLQMSPVTTRIGTENNDDFPCYVLPASCNAPTEPSLPSFNPISSSMVTTVNNQQITSSPVRQTRTPRSKRTTPKPSTLSSSIARSRPLYNSRSTTQRSLDDTTLLTSPFLPLRTSNIPPIAPSSVPTPRRSNGPYARNDHFTLGPAWKPPKQLVHSHVQAIHANIAAKIESWKQKTREDLKRQDLDKKEPAHKLASKREALISRKKNEKRSELLIQELQIATEENLILKHELEQLTEQLQRQKIENL